MTTRIKPEDLKTKTMIFSNGRGNQIQKIRQNWVIVLIICLLSISIIVILGFKANEETKNIVQEQFSQRQLILSKQISAGMNEFLNEKTTVIEIMALHVSNASQDEILAEFVNVHNKTGNIYVFEYINQSGVVSLGYPGENTPLGYDLYKFERPEDDGTGRMLIDTFEWVRDKRETRITRPVRLLEGGFGAFIWTPVYKGDEFKGIILSIITISDISNRFLKDYDGSLDIHMTDDRGNMFYDNSFEFEDREKHPDFHNSTDPGIRHIFQSQLEGKEGTGYYSENIGNEKKFIAYSPVIWRNQNWSIAVISPESEINSLVYSVYLKQGLFIVIAIGFILISSISIILLLSRWNRFLELEVAKKTTELNESNKLLQNANEKLKEIDKLKSDFLSMISHELRTPLTAMKVSSEVLLESDSKLIEGKDLIQILIRNIDRMTRLVNNLLDISIIETARMKYDMELVDLTDIIDTAIGTIRSQFKKKGLKITTVIPEDLPKIKADRDRIIQVFINLLSNALKFTPEGGNVEIRAFEFEKKIEIHVKDDGIGIPPDKIDTIFDKFSHLNNTATHHHSGAGLGLAITRGIMEGHGGFIRAESSPSKGSVFILTFNK